MNFLRTNTATRVSIGPFVNISDGITPITTLTVTACKLTLIVDTGGVPTLVLDTSPTASGGANDMIHISGDDAGWYDLELAAANVNYLGRAKLSLTDASTHLPVFHEFMIVPAMIYDSLILGTDRFDTNVTHIGDTSQTARDIGASVLLSSGTGTGQLKLSSGYVAPNWGDVGNPTTTVGLSGTTVKAVTDMTTTNVIQWKGATAPAMTGDAYAELTAIIADSLPADGTRPTLVQAVYGLYLIMTERSVSGVTLTVKKVDGLTTAMTFTLNDALEPSSITRVT